MVEVREERVKWDRLHEFLAEQQGWFTARQARKAGFSTALLAHHLRTGLVERSGRGLYRLSHYPRGEHEELVVAWLWSDQAGVFSHQTALALRGLSDVMPAQLHMTLPRAWPRRRRGAPEDVVLYYADIPVEERGWFGVVPITNVRRTLHDCMSSELSPELLRQATQQALRRGLVAKGEVVDIDAALRPFGGVFT